MTLLLSATILGHSQISQPTTLTKTPDHGSGHEYLDFLNETIDPSTGTVQLRIGLPAPPSRGPDLPVSLEYNSNGELLANNYQAVATWTHIGFSPSLGGNIASTGTWSYSLPTATANTSFQSDSATYSCTYYQGFLFWAPDGTSHALHVAEPQCNGVSGPTPVLTGTDTKVNASLQLPPSTAYAPGSLQVWDHDGTVYSFPSSTWVTNNLPGYTHTGPAWSIPSKIEDRNGNVTTIKPSINTNGIVPALTGFSVIDTFGRIAVSVPVLVPTSSSSTTTTISVGPDSYVVTWTQAPFNFSMPNSLTANPVEGCSLGASAGSEWVISSIALPNGQSYHFYYGTDNPDPNLANPYGLISEIVYPTGAWIKYKWKTSDTASNSSEWTSAPIFVGSNLGGNVYFNQCVADYAAPVLASRTTGLAASSNPILERDFTYWTGAFSAAPVQSYKTTDEVTTDFVSAQVLHRHYIYSGAPPPANNYYLTPPYVTDMPEEQSTQLFAGSSTTPTTTTYKAFDSNEELVCSLETEDNGLTGGHLYQYEYGEISDDKEFSNGQISNPSSACAQLGSSGTVPAREQLTTLELIQGPQGASFPRVQSEVTQSSGTTLAETDSYWDTAPVVAVSGLPANTHDDQLYGANVQSGRGNLTSQIKRCTPSCTNLAKSYTYDVTGQMRSSTDGLGKTTFDYTDSPSGGNVFGNSNGYLTTMTKPQTGVVNHVETFQYNYTTGRLSLDKDANGAPTSFGYADPLHRLTDIYGPPSPQNNMSSPHTQYIYQDGQTPSVTSINPVGMMSALTLDGFGRKLQTSQLSDPAGSSYIDYSYDGLNRISSASQPHRSAVAPTDGITTYTYDVLNRPVTQTQSDGTSTLQWCYNGNATSSAQTICSKNVSAIANSSWIDQVDETGRHWQQVSDALGRLGAVMEPDPMTGALALETDYSYDLLNNLLNVNQKGSSGSSPRTRLFTYNSLSQLLTSTNPETGTICYGTWSGKTVGTGICSNGYDPNGNLLYKTDARGVVVTNSYDALNRLYSKSYSTTDPSVFMQYDLAATSGSDPYPIGRMTLEWTGPSSTAPTTSTSLTSVPAGAYTSKTVLLHDPMGRIASEQQCPLAPCSTAFKFAYSYDLAGNLTSFNNGLPAPGTTSLPGLAWTASYDGAGRINGVQTSTQPWTPSAIYPTELVNLALTGNSPSYDPLGHIVNEQASIYPTNSGSPGLTVTDVYDNRGRVVTEVGQGQGTSSAASQSVGLISVTGSEGALTNFQATPGSTTFSVTGMDATHLVCVNVPAATLSTSQPNVSLPPPTQKCSQVPDSGSLSVTVDGFTSTAAFTGSDNDSTIASKIASGFMLSGSPVSAFSNGSSVTITANTTGAATNYSISFSNLDGFVFSDPNSALTGGQNGTVLYDSGTLTATITNTSVTPNVSYTTNQVSWGNGTLSGSLATNLAAAIKAAAGSLVTASASGSDIKLVSVATGPATNYSVSVNSADAQPASFPTPSFNAAAGSMSGGAAAATSNGTVYSYSVPSGGYAANGNILSQSDSVMGDWNFGYDNLNRLTSGTAATGPYAGLWGCWAYDSFGNRTQQSFQSALCTTTPTARYNANNQVTFVSQGFPSSISAPSGFTYEAGGSGNVTFDGQNNYIYDAEGRVCAVGSILTGSMAAYIYDAEGRRVGKGNITTLSCNIATNGFSLTNEYLLGLGGEQVTELKNTGLWVHSNVWTGAHLDATYDPKGLHFHLADPLGTRRVQLNAQGAVEETCQSLPFGDALQCSQTGIASADDATEHHFTGKERDAESGLDYFGLRYYGSSMGRFMSPDWSEEPAPVPYADVENPQTLNLYGYVTNNPLRLYDPTGHAGCCDVLPSMAEVDAGIAYLEGGLETAATVSAGAVVGTIGLIGSQIFAPSQMGNDPAERRYILMMSKGGNQNHSDSYFENLSPEELEALLRDPRTSPSDRAKIIKQQKANATRNAQKRGGGKQKKPPVKNDPASVRARQQQANQTPTVVPTTSGDNATVTTTQKDNLPQPKKDPQQ